MFRVAVLQSAAVDRKDVPLGTSAQEDEWELLWERMSQSECAFAHRTSAGVYLLFDQSGTPQWGEFNIGLPYSNVADLEYSSTLSALAAGAYGRGVYVADLKNLALPSVKVSLQNCS